VGAFAANAPTRVLSDGDSTRAHAAGAGSAPSPSSDPDGHGDSSHPPLGAAPGDGSGIAPGNAGDEPTGNGVSPGNGAGVAAGLLAALPHTGLALWLLALLGLASLTAGVPARRLATRL
jgi:hypothetical protein